MKRGKFQRTASSGQLVNNLSVKDARHMLHCEGGEFTAVQGVLRLTGTALVAVFTARAILKGSASAIHLALPMVAEYMVLLLALPVLALIRPDPAVMLEAKRSLRLVVALIAGWAVWAWFRSSRENLGWNAMLVADVQHAWGWIAGHQMHWPMLLAAGNVLAGLPGRLRNLKDYGPPFMPVGLGCGMRVAVLFLGIFLMPWIIQSSARVTWSLWALIVLAEVGAVVMLWDIQKRLRRLPRAAARNDNSQLP